jgi:cyclopropane-fatty-acyl-phospholipid synthase
VLARFAAARAEAVVARIDAGLATGSLDATLPGGRRVRLGGRAPGPAAAITLANWTPVVRLMLAGSAGFARAHFDGDWTSPAPEAIFALFVANRTTLGATARARGPWRLANRLVRAVDERLRPRDNIAFHYDLGNDFYAAWLDPGMTYSSALFAPAGTADTPSATDDLEAAQTAKVRALLDAVGVRPGDRVLEIGCGWGGLAEIATRDYGADVHGITLSAEQLAYCRARVPAATFALTDYRAVTGTYDHVVSVEMFEAVGMRHWSTFMAVLRRVLKPGGRAGLQVITIADDVFDAYRRSTDFIQAYIFPGGMLPSPGRFRAAAAGAGLVTVSERWFGRDYARTLRLWRARFDAAVADGRLPPGFDDRFIAIWRYYLMYCEGGFDGGGLDVGQLVLTFPTWQTATRWVPRSPRFGLWGD